MAWPLASERAFTVGSVATCNLVFHLHEVNFTAYKTFRSCSVSHTHTHTHTHVQLCVIVLSA